MNKKNIYIYILSEHYLFFLGLWTINFHQINKKTKNNVNNSK